MNIDAAQSLVNLHNAETTNVHGGLVLKSAKAKYSFAIDGGAVSIIILATNFTIPDNAIIVAVTLNATTALTSDGASSIKIGLPTYTNLLKTELPYTSYTLDVVLNGTPTFATPYKMPAASLISLTILTAALTAGVIDIYILYYEGSV